MTSRRFLTGWIPGTLSNLIQKHQDVQATAAIIDTRSSEASTFKTTSSAHERLKLLSLGYRLLYHLLHAMPLFFALFTFNIDYVHFIIILVREQLPNSNSQAANNQFLRQEVHSSCKKLCSDTYQILLFIHSYFILPLYIFCPLICIRHIFHPLISSYFISKK